LVGFSAIARQVVWGPARGSFLVSAPPARRVALGRGGAGGAALCPAVLSAPVASDHASGAVPHHGGCRDLLCPSGGHLLARDAGLLARAAAGALARSCGSRCRGRAVVGGVSLATPTSLAAALVRAAPTGGHAAWLRRIVRPHPPAAHTERAMSISAWWRCLPSVLPLCWQGVWRSRPGCSTSCT